MPIADALCFYQGARIHDGTWKSAVYGLADHDNLKKLRKQIGSKPLPVIGAKLKRRYKKLCVLCVSLVYNVYKSLNWG